MPMFWAFVRPPRSSVAGTEMGWAVTRAIFDMGSSGFVGCLAQGGDAVPYEIGRRATFRRHGDARGSSASGSVHGPRTAAHGRPMEAARLRWAVADRIMRA